MNDPGLDDPIADSAPTLERDKTEKEEESAVEDNFLTPSRWWFASTAAPLLAV